VQFADIPARFLLIKRRRHEGAPKSENRLNCARDWLSISPMEMDEETRRLAEEVGTAINESVQQSASVAAAIERLREAGFEMELTLKLEIGLRPQNEDEESEDNGQTMEFTEEDLRILRSMKIKIDPEE
jgi:DNA primase